jgi:hypothetical protein
LLRESRRVINLDAAIFAVGDPDKSRGLRLRIPGEAGFDRSVAHRSIELSLDRSMNRGRMHRFARSL